MVKSMTAFAKQQQQNDYGILTWEIRSVNNRYLDLNFKLPEFLRELEMPLRQTIKTYLARGKVDIILRYLPGNINTSELTLNDSVLQQLKATTEQISQSFPEVTIDFNAIMKWPGLIQTHEKNLPELKQAVKTSFQEALEQLCLVRSQEGKDLAIFINQRLIEMTNILMELKEFLPQLIPLQRERLLEKFQKAQLELEETRLEQEMLLLAQKIDVHEEVDRLTTHVQEVQRLLDSSDVVGRRLDFLCQEMNREANTLGSKSIHEKTTQASINLKVLIEQIREQMQNME